MSRLATHPDLYLPRKQPPTERDRETYLAVATEERMQKEVAAEFGVSQPRVAQIVQSVAQWIEQSLPPDEEELAAPPSGDSARQKAEMPTAERLRLAEFTVHERLEFVYAQSLAGWRKSLEPETKTKTRVVRGQTVEEVTTRTQCGRVGYLNQAMRATLAIGRLAGVDVTGKEARKLAEQGRASQAAAPAELATPAQAAPCQSEATPEVPAATLSAGNGARTTYTTSREPAAPLSLGADLYPAEDARSTYFSAHDPSDGRPSLPKSTQECEPKTAAA